MNRAIPLLLLFAVGLFGCQSVEKKEADQKTRQQETVRAYVDTCWNMGNLSPLSRIVGEGYVRELNGLEVANGKLELEAHIRNFVNAFPNLHISIDQLIENDQQIVVVWEFNGTNTGDFTEFMPTGKKAKVKGVSLITLDSYGKMVKENTFYNELYLLQQLGYTLNPPNLE